MTGIYEKAKVQSWSIGFLCCIIFAVAGCNHTPRIVIFCPDIEPSDANAYCAEGMWSAERMMAQRREAAWCYKHSFSEAEFQKGEVVLPHLTFGKKGYTPFTFPSTRIPVSELIPGHWGYSMLNEPKVTLKIDPKLHPNKIELEVNSEPLGARVYEKGRLKGITPFTITYVLRPKHYETGRFVPAPLLAAKEGCIPKEHELTFIIDPEWRHLIGRAFEEGTVFLLESDLNYNPPPQPIVIQQKEQVTQSQYGTQRHHLTIKKEDSFLDEALKFMQVMSIGQTLRPVLKP